MEDIQARLEETSQNCLKTYVEWVEKKQDPKAQEELHSAIHELRKVSSRLEIELAISERDQMTSKPLPIPSHRSTNKNAGTSILDSGPGAVDNGRPVVQTKSTSKRRRPPRKQGGGSE